MTLDLPEYPNWGFIGGDGYTVLGDKAVRVLLSRTANTSYEVFWTYVPLVTPIEWTHLASFPFSEEEDELNNRRKVWEDLASALPERLMEAVL